VSASRAAFAALVLGLAGGCTDSKPYQGVPDKNLQVRIMTPASIAVEVHSLGESCTRKYEGFVSLDRSIVEVGLPAEKSSLLVFEFLRAGDASIKKEVQLLPRAGNRYELRVAYKDPIHDIELREIDSRTGADREIDTRRSC
jgi:hypothetical protein